MAVDKDFKREQIFDEIYDLITTNIVDIQVPDRGGTAWWHGEFTKSFIKSLLNRSNYPLGAIQTPKTTTMDLPDLEGNTGISTINIDISVFDYRLEKVAEIADQITKIIKSNLVSLRTAGLKAGRPLIVDDEPGFDMRGDIPVHSLKTTYQFIFSERS